MLIGPFGSTGFHMYGKDAFHQDGYQLLNWYEVDPLTHQDIRHCQVTLNSGITRNSNIYFTGGCGVNHVFVQECCWTKRDVDNVEIDQEKPGMAAYIGHLPEIKKKMQQAQQLLNKFNKIRYISGNVQMLNNMILNSMPK